MSVSRLHDWRLPGCGTGCVHRQHDPHAHELWGLLMATLTPPTRVIRTGPLAIDLDARRVTVEGEDVHLSKLEWGYLAYLAERLGAWCPHDEILEAVWGPGATTRLYALGKDGSRRRMDLAMVNVRRNALRLKLGAAGRLIATEYRHVSGSRLEREEPT